MSSATREPENRESAGKEEEEDEAIFGPPPPRTTTSRVRRLTLYTRALIPETGRATQYPVRAQPPKRELHPGVRALWNGQWRDAEAHLAGTRQQGAHTTTQWAIAPLYQYALTGAETLVPEIERRFKVAETTCTNELASIEADPKTSFMRHRVGIFLKYQVKANLSADERECVADWNRAQGDLLVCMLVRAYLFMIAGHHIRAITKFQRICSMFTANAQRFRNSTNGSAVHSLVISALHHLARDWPSMYHRAIRRTVQLPKLASVNEVGEEVQHYADLFQVYVLLEQTTEEYRKDRTTLMKRAHDVVSKALAGHPQWVHFRRLKAQVLCRLGRPDDAVSLLLPEFPPPALPERTRLELAAVAFVKQDWLACEQYLRQAEPPKDPQLVLMLAASLALRGEPTESMHTLKAAEPRYGKAWAARIHMLQYRPHKNTLYYELCYMFGFMAWFDKAVYGTLSAGGKLASERWLEDAALRLGGMLDAANILVVYPEKEYVERCEAYEQQLSVAFMCGFVACMREDFKGATKFFQFVLDNAKDPEARKGVAPDPWHVPAVHYELGCLALRQGKMIEAAAHLKTAAQHQNFLYAPVLRRKIRAAQRHLDASGCVAASDWLTETDELGERIGDAGGTRTATVPAGGVFALRRKMAVGATLKCTWGVEASNVAFEVLFVGETGGETVFDELSMTETLDVKECFYTSREAGEAVFRWDNTHCENTTKVVFYSIEEVK